MISRGSWRLLRKCANGKRRRSSPPRRRGRPTPDHIQKAGGRSVPAARGPGSWRGRAAREPGHLREAGAAAAAQVRSRLSPTWRGGGGSLEAGAPRAGRLSGGQSPPRRSAPGKGGSGPAPEAISFCASHMKAASRAPGPRCRRRRGERELHCAARSGPPRSPSPPRAPRAAQRRPPRPCPRRASRPRSLPSRLARSLPASQARRPRVCGVCRARAV